MQIGTMAGVSELKENWIVLKKLKRQEGKMGLTAIFCHFVSLSKSRAKPTFARIYGPLLNKNFLPFSLGEKRY